MNPVAQTLRGRGPKFGEACGNCLQASLASILELPLSAVPHFCNLYAYGEAEGGSKWQERMNDWLDENFHLRVIYMPASYAWTPTGYHLRDGISPRGSMHVTVGFNGQTVHDPHPEGGALTGNIEYGIFVSTNPARHTGEVGFLLETTA